MKERPILFSAPMIRALLAGSKSQTRRLVTVPWKGSRRTLPYSPYWGDNHDDVLTFSDESGDEHPAMEVLGRPYGNPGERLWVKETFQPIWAELDVQPESMASPEGWAIHYVADGGPVEYQHPDDGMITRCTPAIFMRRWMSRITLEVLDIRIERLQAITEEDARAEGVSPSDAAVVFDDKSKIDASLSGTARGAFACLWDSINGKRAPWSSDPWIWRIEFRKVAS